MRSSLFCLAASLTLGPLFAGAAPAQTVGDSVPVYRREIFHYSAAGRPDPFRSLLQDSELGMRLEDLTLRGIVYHSDPARSVAVLSRRGVQRPIRGRVGDRIGGVLIAAIRPRSVEVVLEEFGGARRATLELKSDAQKGES